MMDTLQFLVFWSSFFRKVLSVFDTDEARQCSVSAHAFPPLPVPAQSGRKLSLAFPVAARCGVVEQLLNKWWSSFDIMCCSAQKSFYVLVCPESMYSCSSSLLSSHFLSGICILPSFVFHSSSFLDSAELRVTPTLSVPTNLIVFLKNKQLFWLTSKVCPLLNMWSVLLRLTHMISRVMSSQQTRVFSSGKV